MRRFYPFFRSILFAGVKELPRTFKCAGINAMSMAIIFINITAGGFFWLITDKDEVLYGCLVEISLISLVIYLNSKMKYAFASILFFGILNAATFYFAALLGKDVHAQLMVLFLICLSFILFDNGWVIFVCILLTYSNLMVLEKNFEEEFIPSLQFSESVKEMMRHCSYLVITILVILAFHYHSKITAWKEKILEKSYNELDETLMNVLELNTERRELLRDSAHEIKTSFVAVARNAELLINQEKMGRTVAAADFIRKALDISIANFKLIVSNLLLFSKAEFGIKDKPIIDQTPIRQIIEDVVEVFRFWAADDKDARIEIDVREDVPEFISCDVTKLRQILNNLLDNAVKFVRNRGQITVTVEMDRDSKWQLIVINEGEGIPKEILNKVFRPYQSERTGINMDWNGLGLYITQKLVTEMNGQLAIHSFNRMTVFEISFPMGLQAA